MELLFVSAEAFGQRWGPEADTPDKVFGFSPGNGVHDIHMNQGNTGRFVEDDGVWQDGGLLLHYPGQDQWVGVFLAFQSQAWHTDDTTGHTDLGVPDPGPAPQPAPGETGSHGADRWRPGQPWSAQRLRPRRSRC
jgi:hypothetical protein